MELDFHNFTLVFFAKNGLTIRKLFLDILNGHRLIWLADQHGCQDAVVEALTALDVESGKIWRVSETGTLQ